MVNNTKLPFIRDYTKAGFTKSHVNDLWTKEKLRAKARFESGVGRVHQASQFSESSVPSVAKIIRVYSCQLVAKILRVFVSSWLNTKIAHFESIMQNKPNTLNTQMNVSSVITKHYENIANWKLGENKPNSKPIKANTNPIQTQFARG